MNFALRPFETPGPSFPFSIGGTATLKARDLVITYVLRGPLEGLIIPGRSDRQTREHGLWKRTCFEFFLAAADSPQYWEFNLSPSENWNVYRFERYRQGMEEERAFSSLPFRVSRRAGSFVLNLTLDTGTIIGPGRALDLGVSAVTGMGDGTLTHWALVHPGPLPDFHRRDGFVISLTGGHEP